MWSVVYLFLGLPEPPIGKHKALHLFWCIVRNRLRKPFNNQLSMFTTSSTLKGNYASPRSESIHVNLSSILCDSQGEGQNEDVEFEDWDIDDTNSPFLG